MCEIDKVSITNTLVGDKNIMSAPGLRGIEKLEGSMNLDSWTFDIEWKYVGSSPAADDIVAAE